jgi:hypothetical protein
MLVVVVAVGVAAMAAKDMREAGAGVMVAMVMGGAGVAVIVEAIAVIRDGGVTATGAAMAGAAAIGVGVIGAVTGGGLITDMA